LGDVCPDIVSLNPVVVQTGATTEREATGLGFQVNASELLTKITHRDAVPICVARQKLFINDAFDSYALHNVAKPPPIDNNPNMLAGFIRRLGHR
jgi:hypothetical protein